MEDSITGLVPHVLSHIISEYCKNGFMLAYEKGLSDLKGLVPADSIAPDDFELLESVGDPVINILLNSIDKVIDCSRTYFLINNLDELEIMENEEYNQLASDNVFSYIIEWETKNYKDVLDNLNTVYFSIAQLLYHTACQIRLDSVDIPEEMYDEFLDKYSDLLLQKVYSSNKNIDLLYDLIFVLNEDLLEIDRITRLE